MAPYSILPKEQRRALLYRLSNQAQPRCLLTETGRNRNITAILEEALSLASSLQDALDAITHVNLPDNCINRYNTDQPMTGAPGGNTGSIGSISQPPQSTTTTSNQVLSQHQPQMRSRMQGPQATFSPPHQ